MTTPKIKKAPKKEYAFGTLSLIETHDGDLRLSVDIEQNETTSPEILTRIKSILCGLSFIYNRDGDSIAGLGAAYIEGMETAIEAMQRKYEGEKGGGGGEDNGLKMGFTAKI